MQPLPNSENSFDKLFTDQAWANMSALLDQEMPVEKPRRRGFLLFWDTPYRYTAAAASVVLALSLGAWHWNRELNMGNKSILSAEKIDNQPITNNKNIVTQETVIEKRLAKTKEPLVQLRHHAQVTKQEAQQIAIPITSPIASLVQFASPENSVLLQNNIANLPALPIVSLENAPIVDKIATAFATIPIDIQKNNPRKRNFKLGVNAIFNTSATFIGGEIGAMTAFNLHEKNELSVGLSAARRNYSVVFAMHDSLNHQHFDATTTVNSVQLPIVLSRRVSKNWSVGAGITTMYNVMQNSKVMDTNAFSAPINANNVSKFNPKTASIVENNTKADLYIEKTPQNTADLAAFSTTELQHNLRKFNILSGLYAKYALKKTNITASIDYNLLGYNVTTNQGHNVLVKVGLERVF
jgi:hypothetical protein